MPDDKLRAHLVKSMAERITSLKKELNHIPPREEVIDRLVNCFKAELGVEFKEDVLSDEELEELTSSPSWRAGLSVVRSGYTWSHMVGRI